MTGNGETVLASAGAFRAAARTALTTVLCTRSGRVVGVATVLLGVSTAAALAVGAPPGERTFPAVSGPVQSVMSVTGPFLGVLLVHGARRPARPWTLLPVVAAALTAAAGVAVVGIALSAGATVLPNAQPPAGRWANAGAVILGSVLAQVVAALTGTGLGLLVRRSAPACLLTVVLPLGLWLLSGAMAVLRPVQAWLTPYASAQHLLAGDMSPVAWARWLVVIAIWGLGLNVAGWRRAARGRPGAPGALTRPSR